MAKKAPAKKPPAKRRIAKKPQHPEAAAETARVSSFRSVGLAVLFVACGMIAGAFLTAAGGKTSGGSSDSLAASHVNDRASQVRILREYATKEFASDSEAQKWINEQRIAARPNDWIPFTDELGAACSEGPEAVKAFADRLEVRK